MTYYVVPTGERFSKLSQARKRAAEVGGKWAVEKTARRPRPATYVCYPSGRQFKNLEEARATGETVLRGRKIGTAPSFDPGPLLEKIGGSPLEVVAAAAGVGLPVLRRAIAGAKPRQPHLDRIMAFLGLPLCVVPDPEPKAPYTVLPSKAQFKRKKDAVAAAKGEGGWVEQAGDLVWGRRPLDLAGVDLNLLAAVSGVGVRAVRRFAEGRRVKRSVYEKIRRAVCG